MFIYVQEVCGAAAGRGNDSHPHCSKRSFSCVFFVKNIHINMNMSVMTLKVTKFNCFVCLALYFLFLLHSAAPSDHHFNRVSCSFLISNYYCYLMVSPENKILGFWFLRIFWTDRVPTPVSRTNRTRRLFLRETQF